MRRIRIKSLRGGRAPMAMAAAAGKKVQKGRGTMPMTQVPKQSGTNQQSQNTSSDKK